MALDIPRLDGRFEVISDYQPAGDQPAAIDELERRVRRGDRHTVLLGATGTGKSATTAWLIERLQRPALVMAPNKTLCAQLAKEFRELLPNNAVEYFVSYYDYYQPEAYIAADRHLHREGLVGQRGGRAAAALGHDVAADPARRDRGRDRQRDLRPGHPAGIRRPGGPAQGRQRGRPRQAAAPAGRHPVRAQRHGLPARHVPGARRHAGDHPGVRGAGRPGRAVRRRGGEALLPAPADRRGGPRGRRADHLPGDALRGRPGADGAGDPRHRGRAGGAAGRAGAAGQAARGAAAADAHDLRHRDDAPGRLLQRHRELLDAHGRPAPGEPPYMPARLLPGRLPHRHRRVARDDPADRRHVRGRRLPQADPDRARLPAAQRGRQPAAAVRRVPRAGRPDGVPVRDARARGRCSRPRASSSSR